MDVFTAQNFMFVAIGLAALGHGLKSVLGEKKTALATEYGVLKEKCERLETDERGQKARIHELEAKLHDSEGKNRELTALIRLDTVPTAMRSEFDALKELVLSNQPLEEIRTIVDGAARDLKEHGNALVVALRTDLGETLSDMKTDILNAATPTVKER